MTEEDEPELRTLEQEVFKALDHQTRRDILRYVGEGKSPTFTDILNTAKLPDSPTLSYHLKTLCPFIEQHNGKYHLTPMGKDAYSLLLKAGTYDKLTLFQKKRFGATLGNTILWGTAILAAAYLGVHTTLTAIILPMNAAIAISTTYQLFKQ